jgi:transposase-like protein
MRKARFTEEQISFALRQAESGSPFVEVCRNIGVSKQTIYRWKRKYVGIGVAELRRIRQLEEENRKLKKIVAALSLDKHILQEVLSKKGLMPARKRPVAEYLIAVYKIDKRRACRLLKMHRSMFYFKSHTRDQQALLRIRLRDLAAVRVKYGYKRLCVLLRRIDFTQRRIPGLDRVQKV